MADAAAQTSLLPSDSGPAKKAARKAKRSSSKKAAKAAVNAAPPPAPDSDEAKAAKRKKAAKKRAKKKREAAAAAAAASAAAVPAKKTGKKKGKKRNSKKIANRNQQGCSAIVHVMPTSPELIQLAAWSDLTRQERRRALIMMGAAVAVTAGITFLLFRPKKAKAATPKPGTSKPEDTEEEVTAEDETIDVDVEQGARELPPAITMGNIPPAMTRVYQIFDRFCEGASEFFANVADGESVHNIFAINPAGIPLSRAGVERQMAKPDYGDEWDGKGTVPYTEYLEPDKAKALGAMGLFQGIAGTIGQAGRRNGTAILAPIPVEEWMEPANQLAAFMELFGSLYHTFGAKTPRAMRIAWGYPSKANKVNDPYYISRSAKWDERQKKTGVSIDAFSNMTLRNHSVEEVVAYFKQFDYTPIVEYAKKIPRMSFIYAPLSSIVLSRVDLQADSHPAFIGNDLT